MPSFSCIGISWQKILVHWLQLELRSLIHWLWISQHPNKRNNAQVRPNWSTVEQNLLNPDATLFGHHYSGEIWSPEKWTVQVDSCTVAFLNVLVTCVKLNMVESALMGCDSWLHRVSGLCPLTATLGQARIVDFVFGWGGVPNEGLG